MDALVMALSALAAGLLVGAVESRRTSLLVAWAIVMGLSFNVKFLGGVVLMPAALLYAAVRWRSEWRERLRPLTLAAIAGAIVTIGWITFYDLTTPGSRPLVMNDSWNSAYGLVLRINGIERVLPGEITVFLPVGESPAARKAAEAERKISVSETRDHCGFLWAPMGHCWALQCCFLLSEWQ